MEWLPQCIFKPVTYKITTFTFIFLANMVDNTKTEFDLQPEIKKTKTKLCGLSQQSNYTDRATAACRRS
jgi:hypothetical protein